HTVYGGAGSPAVRAKKLHLFTSFARPSPFSGTTLVHLDPPAEIAMIRPPFRSMLSRAFFFEDKAMTRSQPSARADQSPGRQRRSHTLLAAFGIGLPLAGAIFAVIFYGPLQDNEVVRRYLKHFVEQVEVVMFCCALGVLLYKLLRCSGE